MTTIETQSVGDRVKAQRKAKGFTQVQLAQKANVSDSLVSQVERGVVPATPGFISSVGPVLGLSTADLLGQPFASMSREDEAVHAGIPDIRRELASYRIPAYDREPRSYTELAGEVARASRLRHGVQLREMGMILPAVLHDLRVAWTAAEGTDRERIMALAAEAYAAAGQMTYKVGEIDLASICTDRFEWAAEQSDDPLLVLVGDYQRAGELINAADWDAAATLLDSSRARIESELSDSNPALLSMWGNLHLKSGLSWARAGRKGLADDHLAEATDTARRLGVDRDDYRLCFGPTNAGIWAVGLAVEAMDGTTAVARAAEIEILPGTPRERVGHHYIDLARGFLLHGDRNRCLSSLQKAKEVAPTMTRYHPMVRETVGQLLRDQARSTETVRGFAAWCGITRIHI